MMKKISGFLAVITAVAIILSAFTTLSFAVTSEGEDSAEYVLAFKTGDTVYFGEYPASLIEDLALCEALEKEADSCDANGDLSLGGLRFRRVCFEEYRDAGFEEGSVYDGNTQVANGYESNQVYWFRYEPIAWRVLNDAEGKVLLMTEKAIDSQPYNTDCEAVTWETSSVREWLNGDFFDIAFTADQQEDICDVSNVNNDNPIYGSYNGVPSPYAGEFKNGYPFAGTEGGKDTVDKVFLPSFDEITDKAYGFNLNWTEVDDFGRFAGYYDTDSARLAVGTDYALSQGIWTEHDTEEETKYSRYWLRTPGYGETYAAGVLDDGRVSTGWFVNYTVLGIRPLICVDSDFEQTPLKIGAVSDEFRYKEKDVRLFANMDNIKWSSSNPEIADIDENGCITIDDVGTVTFSATSLDRSDVTATCTVEISYAWWQWLIRIFLFGWIWY